MILSDVSIRQALTDGRILIEPLGENAVQPSSVDLRVDRIFRVFRNYSEPHIDPKRSQGDLTELIEIEQGGAFILHPGEFVLGSTVERVRLPDNLVARLEGKALATTTEVPTPHGWRTMGDLKPGDLVFSSNGLPTSVVAVSEVLLGHECREIVFSDDTCITADIDHSWVTDDQRSRRTRQGHGRIVTTAEIEKSLMVRGERNHRIRLCPPVHYPTRALPVDPYVLGVWLGDGASTAPAIAAADMDILEEIMDAGLGNMHIPDQYLIADVPQRLALLEGLMDSEGYVDTFGRGDFNTTSDRLATQALELGASLGLTGTLAKKTARLHGVDCGPRYEVQFLPDRPVFRLPQKLRRDRNPGRFHHFRAVAAVREVASVPVRCIQVADPSGVFLVTRSYVPTHNSSLGRLGLLIHSTAGFVDPGWDGYLTLELSNVANLPIAIYPAMKIGQISFLEMTTPAEHPYGSEPNRSKYQGQRGPTASRYYLNFPPAEDGG